MLELRELASKHGIAIVVVHHLRKMDSDDAFDTISGTLGLSGAPDTVLVMKYDRTGSGVVILHGRGRDLVEIEKVISFNKDACTWRIIGEVPDVRSSAERKAIRSAMEEIGAPATAKNIAKLAELRTANVRKMLQRMVKQGVAKRSERGKYELTGLADTPTQEEEKAA